MNSSRFFIQGIIHQQRWNLLGAAAKRSLTTFQNHSNILHFAPIAPMVIDGPSKVSPKEIITPLKIQKIVEIPNQANLIDILVPNMKKLEIVDPLKRQEIKLKSFIPDPKWTPIRQKKVKKHLIWIRRAKMKKHKLKKWRKKYLTYILKTRLKREIKKEKLFRAELLDQIKEAEDFDAEKYVKNMLYTIDNKPKEKSFIEWFEEVQELRRQNKSQTHLIRPKFDE